MNIYDIAKEAGVSPATISRVLNGNKNVKETTRRHILEVIREKNYVPNTLARNLSVGESQNIAFLVPDIENPFFSKILHGITDCAVDYNYNVFMFGTDENSEREHRALDSLKAEMIKGLVVIPVCEMDAITAAKLISFEKQGVPVVLIDRDIKGTEFDGVFSEDMEGAFAAVECLIEEGHKKIAVISGPETSKPGRERLRGYQKALEAHQLELNDDYIVNGNFKEEEAYLAMKKLMELEDAPTAIFLSNNMTILGALRYLKEAGKRLTEDVSLVGFDDIIELTYTDVHLTVVTRPVYEMGCEAMELLERRFQNKQKVGDAKLVIRRNSVKTWLVKRGSEKFKKFQEEHV